MSGIDTATAAIANALPANPARGEASVRVAGVDIALRPTFQALVAAEGELGPLFGLVARAADGGIALGEIVALFWHCLRVPPEGLTRAAFAEAIAEAGLSAAMPVLRTLLAQIVAGR